MAMLNNLVTYSTEKFTYANGVFSAEDSSFPGGFKVGRIYDDAADVGFYLESHKTGVKKLFTISKTGRDGEGDITHWEYVEVEKTGRVVPGGLKVVIFND